jgi:hypothetical protein
MGRPVTIATSTPLTKADNQQQQFERLYAADAADHREGGGRQQGQQRGRGERRGQQRHGQQQQQPLPEPGKPVEGCWFCLSSDQVSGFSTEVESAELWLVDCMVQGLLATAIAHMRE